MLFGLFRKKIPDELRATIKESSILAVYSVISFMCGYLFSRLFL